MPLDKPKAFIICTGVGHITRGYESFTIECFENLKSSKQFELFLLKGGGISEEHQIKISCIKRNSKTAKILSRLFKKEEYWIEEFTFLLGMLPTLIKNKPSVIYYSDFILGTFLWHLRRFFKFKYKLLYSNGAPNGPPFKTEDHIQQLLPLYIEQAVEGGTDLSKLTLLPYAIEFDKATNYSLLKENSKLRLQMGLPSTKKIIISIGAVNSHHKRMDYLLQEFALMKSAEFFLLILGQIDENSTIIIEKAKLILKEDCYLIKQVASTDVRNYLATADYFVLASLNEGLPRVLPEALSFGLLPIVHDYQVTRETLRDFGVFKDLTQKGQLQNAIIGVENRNIGKKALIDFAYERFSWSNLSPQYEEMISKLL